MKIELSDIYKHLIFEIAGRKSNTEFQSLLLLCKAYMRAKENEEIKENKK